jgi:hypothetical protein
MVKQVPSAIQSIENKKNFFTKKNINETLKLFFKGDRLKCVPVHRHLGLLFKK